MTSSNHIRSGALRLLVLSLLVAAALLVSAASALGAPELRSTSTAATSSPATSLSVARPFGVRAGDVLVAVVSARQYGYRSLSAPGGWTLVRRDATNRGAEITQAVYVRVAGVSEPSAYAWRFSSRVAAAGSIFVYANVDPSNPVGSSSGAVDLRTSRVAVPSVETPAPDSAVLGFFSINGLGDIAAPSGMQERVEVGSGRASRTVTLAGADSLQANAGATGTRTATFGGTSVAVGQLVTLRPGEVAEPSEPVAVAPTNDAAPSVAGAAVRGETLTASPGSWSGTEPIAYSYRWERSSGGSWVEIPGARASSYVLGDGDVGALVRVVVTASNEAGATAAGSAATAPVTAPPEPESAPEPGSGGARYLSEMPWVSAVNGWGPVERDMSLGDLAAGDGGPLTLNGVAFAKGLGVHAFSDVRFDLAGAYTVFVAKVGVDDEMAWRGSVVFQVFVDGVKAFDSGVMTGSSATKAVQVDVSGARELRLVVTNAGDNIYYDHADWADAQLLAGGSPPEPEPEAAPDPGPGPGAAVLRFAGLEDGSFSEYDQVNGFAETSTARAYEGSWAAVLRTSGSSSYARGIFEVNWEAGTDVWYGMAVYLPVGFYAAQQGQIDILRWDNWSIDPNSTDRSGIVIYGSDKKARLIRGQLGLEQVALVGPFTISEGRWHWLEVHQRLSEAGGQALSEVYLNGQLVGSSTAKNFYGRPVTRIRYGIVAGGVDAQELWLDRTTVSASRVGTLN